MKCQVVLTQEEDWVVAQDVNTRVASQGKTFAEALDNLKEALELYYDGSQPEERCNYPVFLTTLEVYA